MLGLLQPYFDHLTCMHVMYKICQIHHCVVEKFLPFKLGSSFRRPIYQHSGEVFLFFDLITMSLEELLCYMVIIEIPGMLLSANRSSELRYCFNLQWTFRKTFM